MITNGGPERSADPATQADPAPLAGPAPVPQPGAPVPAAAPPQLATAVGPQGPPAALPDLGFTPFPPAPPDSPGWLVSVTLTGNNRDLIGDALGSVVGWVDRCLVIDTGVSDDTLDVARAVAGEKLVVRAFPWIEDFAAARNFGFAAAAALGSSWAVILDTDERIIPNGRDVRALLATGRYDVWFVPNEAETYRKQRCFRLPVAGRFVGPTHEYFDAADAAVGELPDVRFREEYKSRDGYRRKFERDAAILARYTQEHPRDPRWWYYLGDALNGLDRKREAIAAFDACTALNGWDEESAWAGYRAAECWLELGDPEAAIRSCATGLIRHAGLAELPWLAAYASWQANRPAQATYWARLAIAMGWFRGRGRSVPRVGFRHPPALYEGPYDVLRFALRALGDDAGADEAERFYREAKALREVGGVDRAGGDGRAQDSSGDATEPAPPSLLLPTAPILDRMRRLGGWLTDEEGDILLAAAADALRRLPAADAIVEVGSYLGRSTVVLGAVASALRPTARVYAIDPHEGETGDADVNVQQHAPTWDGFLANIAAADLTEVVVPIRRYSFDVAWSDPIALLLVDGLHDATNVSRDFAHFEPWVVVGGLIAFHDYSDNFPGVQESVRAILATKRFRMVGLAHSLIVVEKLADATAGG